MFKYFPTNYVWNLSVDLAIEMGARIGEIEEMCAPLREAAKAPDAAGTQAFRETWVRMADKLCGLAEEDEARGWMYSAGEKYRRASSYLITAERLQAHNAPGRLAVYQRELELFLKGSQLLGDRVQRVEIPYEGTHLSALYYPAHGLQPGIEVRELRAVVVPDHLGQARHGQIPLDIAVIEQAQGNVGLVGRPQGRTHTDRAPHPQVTQGIVQRTLQRGQPGRLQSHELLRQIPLALVDRRIGLRLGRRLARTLHAALHHRLHALDQGFEEAETGRQGQRSVGTKTHGRCFRWRTILDSTPLRRRSDRSGRRLSSTPRSDRHA